MAVLNSSSLTGCNSIPDFIEAGSLMFFQSTSAPIGWTKQITHNNKTLRVVTDNAVPGGTSPFSNVFANRSVNGNVGDTPLTINQIPSHTHPISPSVVCGRAGGDFSAQQGNEPLFDAALAIGPAGGGPDGQALDHNHSYNATLDFRVEYVDLIICMKD